MPRIRRFLPLTIVVLAFAAAGGWYSYRAKDSGSAGEVRYRTAKVQRGPITAVTSASGTLNAVATVQVAAQVSGQVKDILADFNTPVKKGQVLARMDAAALELRANQARADVDAARSAAALAAARERARQAAAELERTVIRAPVDGTVILRNVEAGQTIAPGRQAAALFTIAQDLREMQIEAAVGEADVGRLREGQAASFSVEALPRRRFAGEVRQIRRPSAQPQDATSYTVVISVPNPDLALLPGMTVKVGITVDSRPSALKLPNAALRFRPAPGRVWTVQEGELVPVEVRLGITDGAFTEIVAGALAEGEEVVVAARGAGEAADRQKE